MKQIERWLPIPASPGYEVSSTGRVRSLDRILTRSNGWPYHVQPRLMRVSVHHITGLRQLRLATGVRGKHRTVYPDALVRELFGDIETQAAA